MAMNSDKYITLVIHTPGRAQKLKGFLNSHDIPVEIVPVKAAGFGDECPVRVRIPEDKLGLGLKILESGEDYSTSQIMIKMAGMSGDMLIPVDFSQSALLAVRIGFYIANKAGMRPVIMHAVLEPLFPAQNPDPDVLDGIDEVEIEELKEGKLLTNAAHKKMSALKKEILSMQAAGELPDIKFSTTVVEGVAEEMILQYCRVHNPSMVVMATRGKHKKDEDLIGSVTAEVLDSCRVPLFTVPDNFAGTGLQDVNNLIMFCTLERHDIVSIRALMKTFSYPACDVFLVPVVERSESDTRKKLTELRDYFSQTYPMANFHIHLANLKNFSDDIDSFISQHDIRMTIVPNKKTNIFRRIFRPTLAHRCLFQRDLPMLILPV